MTTYVTQDQIDSIAQQLLDQLEFGNCYSGAPLRDFVPFVLDELRERKLPTRKSLALVIAKVIRLKWHARIASVKFIVEGQQ